MPSIYLAGPISGLTFDAAEAWRADMRAQLAPDIRCFSPLRQKHFLQTAGTLEQSYSMHPLSTDRGIMTRDHDDCRKVDLIFVNFLGAMDRVSIGTVMECAWAFAYRKPLVVAIEAEKNPHDHPMMREACGFRVTSLAAAATIIRALLLPDAGPHRLVPHPECDHRLDPDARHRLVPRPRTRRGLGLHLIRLPLLTAPHPSS